MKHSVPEMKNFKLPRQLLLALKMGSHLSRKAKEKKGKVVCGGMQCTVVHGIHSSPWSFYYTKRRVSTARLPASCDYSRPNTHSPQVLRSSRVRETPWLRNRLALSARIRRPIHGATHSTSLLPLEWQANSTPHTCKTSGRDRFIYTPAHTLPNDKGV